MNIKIKTFNTKNILTNIMASTALGCALSATNSFATEFMFKPSFGVDVGIRSLQFHDLYGKDHFASHYNHISPYFQVQILEHLGVQAGFETSDTRKTNKNYSADESWLNVFTGGLITRFLSSTKIAGEFIGISTNTNTFWQESIPTQLSLFAGIAMLKCKMAHTELLGAATLVDKMTSETMNSNKKAIPKISITASFFVPKIHGLSFKVSYGFEKTSNLAVKKITEIPTDPGFGRKNLLIKLKNSHYTSIGFNYNL